MKLPNAFFSFFLLFVFSTVGNTEVNNGSVDRPLRVMLVQCDRGADNIADDFRPIFNTIE
jgi:hypothetical protein